MKKLLALVLALVMTLGLATVGTSAAFSDADSIQYKEAVEVMSAIGVLDGMDDGNFNPTGTLTREQAAKIIAYMILGKSSADSLSTAAAPFSDVAADRWSAGAIAYCSSEGIIAGKGNGTFGPTEELTGYAFAKMCLVALGYDPEQEGFVGDNWTINTAKLAISAGLNDKLSSLVMSKPITREQASQMALNTEKATMVAYQGGTNITTPDGTKVVSGGSRYFVANNGASDGNIDNDNEMQFAEQYASDLERTSNSITEDFNRPSTVWTYENKTVGAYAKTPALTYTSYLNGSTANKNKVTADVKGYHFGNAAGVGVTPAYNGAGTVITAVGDGDGLLESAAELAAVTENGRTVEVYVSNNIITDIVMIDYVLDAVKSVSSSKVTLKGGVEINKTGLNEDYWDVVSGLAFDDAVVVATDDVSTLTATSVVKEIYVPETVSGTYSKSSGSKYTVGGTAYEAQNSYAAIATDLADTDLNKAFTLTLDKYGYVLAVEDGESSDNYAFVLDASATVTRGVYDYALYLLKTDGTKAWVDVAEVDDDSVADGDVADTVITGMDNGNTFVIYEEGTNGYKITTTASASLTASQAITAITKGTPALTGASLYASNTTVFLYKQSDKTYTVYTGIKNAPSVTSATTDVLANGTAALVVVVDTASSTNAKDQIFIYKDDASGTTKDSTGTIKSYKAIVNGENTTINVRVNGSGNLTNMVSSNAAVPGLYVNSGYTDGYVTSASAPVSADGAHVEYTGVTGDTLADVRLKNGILTVDAGTDKTAVMADSYNLWYIKGTSESAETLSIGKTGTFGSGFAYAAVATGDYFVYVTDDDGFVTDCYFFDADA